MSFVPSARKMPFVDEVTCRTCLKCVARTACRTKAIRSIDQDEPPFIDPHLCMACYDCVSACPSGAIIRPVAIVQE